MPNKFLSVCLYYSWTFGFLLLYSVEIKANGLEQYLPAYAVATNSKILQNSTCKNELNEFRIGIEKKIPWSLKVLDASGQPESGFVYGNNFWLGSKSQCLDLENTKPLKLNPEFSKNCSKDRNTDQEFPPFHLNYFIADFHHNSTLQYHIHVLDENFMSLGLCLPASCSTHQLGEILKKVFAAKTLKIGNLYSINYSFDDVRSTQSDHDYQWLLDWKIITTGTVLIVTIILVIIGTLYDCIVHHKHLKLIKTSNDITGVESFEIVEPKIFGKMLLCFSAYTNTNLIFDTNVSKDTIFCICGIRFLGMLWICLLHSYLYLRPIFSNQVLGWRLSETFIVQILSNGSFSVDTFFCVSGFLISWSFFNKKASECEKKSFGFPWIKYFGLIFTRIIRLAPIYFLTIGSAEIFFGWNGKTSSFIPIFDPYVRCNNYWWRNMLFIHNLFPWDEMCLTWTWYLSNDMQFYIIGTFLLLLSDIYFYTSAFLLMALLITSAIVSGVLSYSSGFTITRSDQVVTNFELYTPPWMRIGPYLVGMIAGYFLAKRNGKLNLNKKIVCLLWIFGSFCNLFTLFGLYGEGLSLISAAIYMALSRIAWGVGIAWILIACLTNNAGFINKILSLKIWIPLSRVTYCAYILNPLVVQTVTIMSESSLQINVFQWMLYYFGLTIVTLFIAFIVTVIFAMPPFLLFQLIFGLQKENQVV